MIVKYVSEVNGVDSIRNKTVDELNSLETVIVCADDLREMKMHLFFASKTYDLIVDYNEESSYLFLDVLLINAKSFTVNSNGKYRQDFVQCMSKSFPDKAPLIRKSVMRGHDIKGLVQF